MSREKPYSNAEPGWEGRVAHSGRIVRFLRSASGYTEWPIPNVNVSRHTQVQPHTVT
jgi:hypothetical protein